MNTFDRHLLREWLYILGIALVLACGLLLVQVMYDDFRDLHDAGASAADLGLYVMVAVPGFLALTLPIVLLVSTLFVLGKLHKANELTAMRAAGVGYIRLMAPVWIVGVACCGVSYWLNSYIVPHSVEKAREMKEGFQYRKQALTVPQDLIGAVYSVGFDNPYPRRMWFFDRYSRYTRKAYGVSVTELDVKGRELNKIEAHEAWFDPDRHGWVFKDGREMGFDSDVREVSSVPFPLKLVTRFREDPELMMLIDRRPIDLSSTELSELIDYLSRESNPKSIPYAVRYYGLIADILVPLIVIAIAIPFAVTGVRVNPAVGVSKAIGLFFLYLTLQNVAAALATNQLIEPALAAWLPNIGMTGFAAYLFSRMR
ncbi:MAG TPA: LptF/LptG family permease [Opitutaceae bacterium]